MMSCQFILVLFLHKPNHVFKQPQWPLESFQQNQHPLVLCDVTQFSFPLQYLSHTLRFVRPVLLLLPYINRPLLSCLQQTSDHLLYTSPTVFRPSLHSYKIFRLLFLYWLSSFNFYVLFSLSYQREKDFSPSLTLGVVLDSLSRISLLFCDS